MDFQTWRINCFEITMLCKNIYHQIYYLTVKKMLEFWGFGEKTSWQVSKLLVLSLYLPVFWFQWPFYCTICGCDSKPSSYRITIYVIFLPAVQSILLIIPNKEVIICLAICLLTQLVGELKMKDFDNVFASIRFWCDPDLYIPTMLCSSFAATSRPIRERSEKEMYLSFSYQEREPGSCGSELHYWSL